MLTLTYDSLRNAQYIEVTHADIAGKRCQEMYKTPKVFKTHIFQRTFGDKLNWQMGRNPAISAPTYTNGELAKKINKLIRKYDDAGICFLLGIEGGVKHRGNKTYSNDKFFTNTTITEAGTYRLLSDVVDISKDPSTQSCFITPTY
jgi:hypothetical protein